MVTPVLPRERFGEQRRHVAQAERVVELAM